MKTKAAVLYNTNQPLVIEELDIPQLNEGQVLVKVLYSGVCHSQLNEAKGRKGEDKYLPHLFGHEGSGIVEEVGSNVTKVRKGDYVVMSWIKGIGKDVSSAQYFKNCIRINSGAIATFSQYSVISENRLFRIPKEIAPNIAALLGCAVPTGAGIVKNEIVKDDINSKKGKSIAIFGMGGVGLSALLYSSSLRCFKIICVDIDDSKLVSAKNFGAEHVINASKENAVQRIKEITGNGADYAIECAGSREAMEAAFESISDMGTVIVAGNLNKSQKISIDPYDLIRGKKIIGTWGGRTNSDKDIPYYAEKYLNNEFDFSKLVTREYPLCRINDAFEDLEKGKVIRAIVSCQEN